VAKLLDLPTMDTRMTFIVRNTFIDGVVSDSNSDVAEELCLRRAHTQPASTGATESKDTDGTVGDHVTRQEEDMTHYVPSPYLAVTDEHPCEWEPHCTPSDAAMLCTEKAAENEVKAEAAEEQETRENEGKIPVSPLGSAAAAAAAAAEHKWQHHCSSKKATPPASTMQRTVKPIEIEVEDEVEEQPDLCSTVTGDLWHKQLPRCFSEVETLPELAMQRTMEATENEIKDEAVEEQRPLCSEVTSELWREWQPRCFSEAATPPAVETDSAKLESKMQVEQQPSPASLIISRQQEPPLNMSPCAQRTREVQPTLQRAHSTASNCIRVV